MKKILFTLLFLSFPAFAGFVYTQKSPQPLTIVGTDAKCTADLDPILVLQLAMQGVPVDEFKEATVTWQGKDIKACWIGSEDGKEALVVDETGDGGIISLGDSI